MILKNGKRLDGCSDTVPVGTINPYVGSIAPYGYLICEGQLVSKTTYKELYEICGDKFGTGTETEFRLPDLRGKTIAGYKEGDTLFGALGKLIGSENHNHDISHTHSVPGVSHAHSLSNNGYAKISMHGSGKVCYDELKVSAYTSNFYVQGSSGGSESEADQWGTGLGGKTDTATPGDATTKSQSTTTSGDTSSIQPTAVMNWIVKAFLLMPNQSYVENSLTSISEINSLSAAKGKELNDKINTLSPLAYKFQYIPANSDLNTYLTEGEWGNSSTADCKSMINGPEGRINGEMKLRVESIGRDNTDFILQTYIARSGTNYQIWHRTCYSGESWSNWYLATSSYKDYLECIYTFTISYSSGTIGTRGVQYTKDVSIEGYTPTGASIYYTDASGSYHCLPFFNNNQVLYLNAYRASTEAVSNHTVRVMVSYVNSAKLDWRA